MFLYVYVATMTFAGLISFLLYGIDKRRARNGSAHRISERTLYRADLLGGWLGGLIARRVFRHKTRKASFRTGAALICAIHVVIASALAFHTFT